jgi:hypothetical protein
METEFPILVIAVPGPDPGIAPTDGVRLGPRIKSGDDEDRVGCPPMVISAAHPILVPMGPVPAICARNGGGGVDGWEQALVRVLARPAMTGRRS